MKGHYYTNLVDCVLAIQGHVLIEDSEVNEVAFSSKWFSNVLDVILEIWMLFKVFMWRCISMANTVTMQSEIKKNSNFSLLHRGT